jgi:hypothetical protein
MNLRLERRFYRPDGIFSDLKDDTGKLIAVTLEHAYMDASGKFVPKIPQGAFTCKRGPHRLHGMSSDFMTFEICGVAGHSNLLFHWGNYNKDSEGCILVGKSIAFLNGMKMITRSRESFDQLIRLQDGVDSFQLIVIG